MAANAGTSARDKIADSPIVNIFGVVSPGGSCGVFRRNDLWNFSATLDRWRIVGSELQSEPLGVSREMTESEFERFRRFDPYAVIHIRARVGRLENGHNLALLEEFVGLQTADAELNDYAEQLQQPVTFDEPAFGTFTLDRRVDWFSGEVIWNGMPVVLHLTDSNDVEKSLATARFLWQDQSGWTQRVLDFAVQELLPVKNEGWLEVDEAELSPDEFKERMMLESISVQPDGTFEFWHDDGDLFWGHSIQIRGNLSEGLKYADIPG